MSKINGKLTTENKLIGKLSSEPSIRVSILGTGARGKTGEGAYEVWLSEGNKGTREDFINDLRGKDGGNYIHPLTHSATMIDETVSRVFISAKEKKQILNTYEHVQIASSKRWLVEHGLGKYPNVSVVDSANSNVLGDIEYVSKNILIISFTSDFSGKAYLN